MKCPDPLQLTLEDDLSDEPVDDGSWEFWWPRLPRTPGDPPPEAPEERRSMTERLLAEEEAS